MTTLFGGKPDNSAAVKAAAESKQAQQVANDRQLASLATADQEDSPTRRNPRGRRLFTEKSTLA